ncbi:SPO22-domain-containing protein [Eremomyces bilateralis CBS 781.70]|uniref:Protein ZIP4 homolog n=1 Tax=Eremomyces bilateralis CBS 781.70 TaxID=1392243 RepID=A0A6G1FRT7_9PEZI|nr:SPO22-domain-containing protein [Eremomyces bilateralis CBS 781.70]KAF1808565.1 SPO22-domain-containing protein [Eremomyces bilateralis CBS 781.70]
MPRLGPVTREPRRPTRPPTQKTPVFSAAKLEKEKKVKNILDFASDLRMRLSEDLVSNLRTKDGALLDLVSDLKRYIKPLPLSTTSAASKKAEFDILGTDLWNLATQLKRSWDGWNYEASKDDTTVDGSRSNPIFEALTCHIRVFSFLLIDTGCMPQVEKELNDPSRFLRLVGISIKSGRTCLLCSELELALVSLERAAACLQVLHDVEKVSGGSSSRENLDPEDKLLLGRYSAEYYGLRIMLAWRQDRLDIAEHMYAELQQSTESPAASLTPPSAEALADMFHTIGRSLLHNRTFSPAIEWLTRARDTLLSQPVERLSITASELKLAVLHDLVKAFLAECSADSKDKAENTLAMIEREHGGKLAWMLLKLDMLKLQEGRDIADRYYEVLLRIIESVILTENIFRMIIHRWHELKTLSPILAQRALDDLLDLRLYATDNTDRIERIVVMRVWVSMSSPEVNESVTAFHTFLESVLRNVKGPFSAQAAHAAQMLIWKKIESCFSGGAYRECKDWCQSAGHHLFSQTGDLNRSTVLRKLMICEIKCKQFKEAKDVYQAMPQSGRDALTTQYLLYKIAIQEGNSEIAAECLDKICRQSHKDKTLLFACVADAQETGEKSQAIHALHKVLEKYDYKSPGGVHLPALLRCTIRLISGEIFDDLKKNSILLEDLCYTYESAFSHVEKQRKSAGDDKAGTFTLDELEWFAKSSYNAAVKLCSHIDPNFLSRLLDSCVEFIDGHIKASNSVKSDFGVRKLHATYLAASAHLVLARGEDDIELSKKHYLSVRDYSSSYYQLFAADTEPLNISAEMQKDLIFKQFHLLKFSLEACLYLSDWTTIDTLFSLALKLPQSRQTGQDDWTAQWQTLGDLTLHLQAQAANQGVDITTRTKFLKYLQAIMNRLRQSPSSVTARQHIARWLRCMFQAAQSIDQEMAVKVLEQAGVLAREWSVAKGDSEGRMEGKERDKPVFPQEEMEWLVATSFNWAVDAYCGGDNGACQKWGEAALGLADALASSGEGGKRLLKEVQERYKKLRWTQEDEMVE